MAVGFVSATSSVPRAPSKPFARRNRALLQHFDWWDCTDQVASGSLAFKRYLLAITLAAGHTEEVAEIIQEELGTETPEDIGDVDISSLASYDGLVVGAPTWNTGADEQRSGTAWDDVLTNIAGLDLSGKPVAVYGLGDSVGYGDYYCDAMEEIYNNFSKAGAKMIGHWPADGYQHAESKAILGDGKFCGLALDQDNEDDLTEERVKTWAKQLKSEGL